MDATDCNDQVEPRMEKFIGVKIVNAMPMNVECARNGFGVVIKHDGPGNAEGYLVEYPGGYQSWCPKDKFEEANRRCDGLTFGHAMEAAKQGKSFKLPQWQDDVSISIQYPDDNSKMTAPYFYVTSRFGMVPWIPTMIEMLSDKWQIVE